MDPRITRLLDRLERPGITEDDIALIERKIEVLRNQQKRD
jgi:hypothetical protein